MIRRLEIMSRCESRNAISPSSFDHRAGRHPGGGHGEHPPPRRTLPLPLPSTGDLKARCDQLISYFDRYGASRGENSDGARNHTRIGAEHGLRERSRTRRASRPWKTLLKTEALRCAARDHGRRRERRRR